MPFFQEAKKKPEEKKPVEKKPDMVKRVQDYAVAERERQRKAEEEKKKKKQVDTAPTQGILSRMYDMFMGSGEKK